MKDREQPPFLFLCMKWDLAVHELEKLLHRRADFRGKLPRPLLKLNQGTVEGMKDFKKLLMIGDQLLEWDGHLIQRDLLNRRWGIERRRIHRRRMVTILGVIEARRMDHGTILCFAIGDGEGSLQAVDHSRQ